MYSTDFDKNSVQGFGGFTGKYLHGEIKREIVEYISHSNNLFFFKVEYITSVIPITKDVDFSQSASVVLRDKNYDLLNTENKEVDESQNSVTDDNQFILDASERPFIEREFYKLVIATIENYNLHKVVFQNKNKVINPVSTMVKYVIFNSK